MEGVIDGKPKDEVHQKLDVEVNEDVVTEDESRIQVDDETWMASVVAAEGNGVLNLISEEDVETKWIPVTDGTGFTKGTGVYEQEENGVLDLIVEERAVETVSSPVVEELKTVDVMNEDISEDVEETADKAKGNVEEEKEVIITQESQEVKAVAVELADVESDQAKSVEKVLSTNVLEAKYTDQEGSDGALKYMEEDSFPAIAKSISGTDDSSHNASFPETNGQSKIISISARTVQPTSWRGCCGLLEVFKRGDR